jgi:hypothetical protein
VIIPEGSTDQQVQFLQKQLQEERKKLTTVANLLTQLRQIVVPQTGAGGGAGKDGKRERKNKLWKNKNEKTRQNAKAKPSQNPTKQNEANIK